jgi:hypothetical protein
MNFKDLEHYAIAYRTALYRREVAEADVNTLAEKLGLEKETTK